MTPVAVASTFGLQSAIQPLMEFSVKQPTPLGNGTIEWCGQPFVWVDHIQPKTRGDGTPWTDRPQERYARAAEKELHRHGAGRFCRIAVSGLPDASGIFVVTLNRRPVYVGIGQSLKQRWGPQQFGSISGADCYEHGQPTNCKVNNRPRKCLDYRTPKEAFRDAILDEGSVALMG